MNYTKFSVSNFRCFENEQTMILAQPVKDKIGSGITYIVGANNSGKTTLIESMWIKKDYYLNDSEKRQLPPEFKFFRESGLARTTKLLRENSYRFIEEPDNRGEDDLFEVISSRRHWNSEASGNTASRDVIKQSEAAENPRQQQGSIQTALYLKSIESDNNKYHAFTSYARILCTGVN